jgi:hypothetical protein
MVSSLILALVASQPVTPFLPPPRVPPAGIENQNLPLPPGALAVDPPHILFLNFGGQMLHGGNCNSSQTNCSFIVTGSTYNFPAYTGTNIAQIVQTVQGFYMPFNVQIVTSRPASGNYSMTMVGPGSAITGTPGAAGVAPLDCGDANQNDVSYAFTDVVSSVHEIAVTIAQESAHGFGLGHTNDPTDIQYPALSGRETAFQNKNMMIYDIGGGSSDCTGTGMQNSYQLLLNNVGPSAPLGPDTTPPTVGFNSPKDGDTVPAAFTIDFAASDDRGVVALDLYVDGTKIGGTGQTPWTFNIPAGTIAAGVHKLKGVGSDMAGNMGSSSEISVTVRAIGETPGDLGSTCDPNDPTGCPGGFCALDSGANKHFCTRNCDAMSNPCPTGFSCVSANGPMVCAAGGANGMGKTGCSVGTSTSSPLAGLLLLGLGAFALVLTRSRRR